MNDRASHKIGGLVCSFPELEFASATNESPGEATCTLVQVSVYLSPQTTRLRNADDLCRSGSAGACHGV